MMKVLLIVVTGKPEGKVIPLTTPVFRVGRDESCHLRPNSVEVSRQHTEITVTEDQVLLKDLGSRNGTRVNGKLITGTHVLRSGELLQIGPLTFAVSIQGAVPAAVAPGVAVARTGSLDDVPPDQIDSWLIADNARPTPDRPSGVYDGDTLTISAFNEKKAAATSPPTQTAAPSRPAPAPAATPAPAPRPAPTPAPAPTPVSISAPAPVAPPPPAPPVPTPIPAAASLPPTPANASPAGASTPIPTSTPTTEPIAAAANAVHTASVSAAVASGATEGVVSFFDSFTHEDFGTIEEGVGDIETDTADELAGVSAHADEAESAGEEMPDELIDPNNPFYVAKMKAKGEAAGAAVNTKAADSADSSQAASDILRKMLDRRRATK